MSRFHTVDTWNGGEIVHESNRNPWLQPLRHTPRKKPSHKPPKRSRPRADPMTHLALVAALLGGLVMFLAANDLYSR